MDGKLLFVLCAIYVVAVEVGIKNSSPLTNTNNLKRCSKCPPGWGTAKKSTHTSDTKCFKCVRGKTYSPYHSKSPCLPCSQCGVGLYESHKCTPIRDTICSECTAYLDHKYQTQNDFSEKCSYLFLK